MKDDKKNIEIVALIAKSFADELLPDQQKRLDEWLAESPANVLEYQKLASTWQKSGEQLWQPNAADVKIAWQKVKAKIATPPKAKVFRLPQFLAVAASLALLISLLFWLEPFTKNAEIIVAATGENADTILLADGSQVVVNKHSTFAYPAKFATNERSVTLVGSAYFTVKANANQPFKISSGNAFVEVVGTKFLVSQAADSVFVAVAEGSVNLYNKGQKAQKLVIAKGQSGCATKAKTPEFVVDLNSKTAVHDLLFEAMSMGEVLKVLEEKYHVHFEVENLEFLACRFSTKLSDATLADALNAIRLVFAIEMVQVGEQIKITGKGC